MPQARAIGGSMGQGNGRADHGVRLISSATLRLAARGENPGHLLPLGQIAQLGSF
jgi:hypothetical protein